MAPAVLRSQAPRVIHGSAFALSRPRVCHGKAEGQSVSGRPRVFHGAAEVFLCLRPGHGAQCRAHASDERVACQC